MYPPADSCPYHRITWYDERRRRTTRVGKTWDHAAKRVDNLRDHWDAAVGEVGLERARAWLLYMSASAVGFTNGGLNLHQVLAVRNDPLVSSGMPPIRPELVG